MDLLKNFFYWVKDILFPQVCALCGCSLIGVSEIRYGLCKFCLLEITPVPGSRCNLCGRPLISEIDYCLSCRNKNDHSYDCLWVIFPYTGKYRKLLTAYKFKKNLALADFLTEKILEIKNENPVLKDAFIVPVPPRPGKIKDTGWDQIDYLVRRMKKIDKKLIICRCLKRSKSKVQKRLNRTERIENLKGRIYPCAEVPQTALIIDDVITTGSTIEVCSAVLKQNGAKKVYGLCLFYD